MTPVEFTVVITDFERLVNDVETKSYLMLFDRLNDLHNNRLFMEAEEKCSEKLMGGGIGVPCNGCKIGVVKSMGYDVNVNNRFGLLKSSE